MLAVPSQSLNADDTEAPAVRDVDVAPLVTAGGIGPLSNRCLLALTKGLSRRVPFGVLLSR
jgi:hypothetical protein